MPDILDTDVVMKDVDSDNKFYQELKRFIKKHEDQLKVVNVHRRMRNIPKNEELMGAIKNEISNYITKLWTGIRTRLDKADTRDLLNCIAFSEAPAEGIFSVWERVISGRESMTLAQANAFFRISNEGPPAGSKSAYKVSKKALDLWPSSQDERFTTKLWFPGLTEKPIRKIMDS